MPSAHLLACINHTRSKFLVSSDPFPVMDTLSRGKDELQLVKDVLHGTISEKEKIIFLWLFKHKWFIYLIK